MPEMSGLEAVSQISEKDVNVKALFLSMYDSDEYVYRVLKSGGMGLINKNVLEGELAYAIEQVFNGRKYFGSKWTKEMLDNIYNEFDSIKTIDELNFDDITFREEQILELLSKGFGSREMAESLNLSKKTVDFYRSSLMKKLNLNTSTELLRTAIKYFEKKK